MEEEKKSAAAPEAAVPAEQHTMPEWQDKPAPRKRRTTGTTRKKKTPDKAPAPTKDGASKKDGTAKPAAKKKPTAPRKRKKPADVAAAVERAAEALPAVEAPEIPAAVPQEQPPVETSAPAVTETAPVPEEPAPESTAEPEVPATPEPSEPAAEAAEPAVPAEDAAAPAEAAVTESPAPQEIAEPSETSDVESAAEAKEDNTSEIAPDESAPTPEEAAVLTSEDGAETDIEDEELTPNEEKRLSDMTRTVQLSIEQIMAAADSSPDSADAAPEEPDSSDAEDGEDSEEEDTPETLAQTVSRSATNMARWLLLVVLFVVIIACGGVAWLYRSATPDMLPQITASFAGQELTPTAYRWKVPVVGHLFKRTYAETISSTPQVLEQDIQSAVADLSLRPSNHTSEFTVTDENKEVLYDGSVSGFKGYLFQGNGTYDAKLVVKISESAADDTTQVTGSETWQFRFTVNIKPVIQLCTASAPQGGVAAVRVGTTLSEEAPTLQTTLKNIGFVRAANGWICYIPIPYNEPADTVDLTVTADGYSEKLQLQIRETNFTYADRSSKSRLTSPYIGIDDAPAKVKALFDTVDQKIQWADGGFVQPFLSNFDTPLVYGMTEYVGRSYSERSTNYGYGGRTSVNAVIKAKRSGEALIVPASGRVLLAEDLGGDYGNTVVIEHGAGLKSIFYGLASLDVKTGAQVKQGQVFATCDKYTIAEMRIGSVPIDVLGVWHGQYDGLKNY